MRVLSPEAVPNSFRTATVVVPRECPEEPKSFQLAPSSFRPSLSLTCRNRHKVLAPTGEEWVGADETRADLLLYGLLLICRKAAVLRIHSRGLPHKNAFKYWRLPTGALEVRPPFAPLPADIRIPRRICSAYA